MIDPLYKLVWLSNGHQVTVSVSHEVRAASDTRTITAERGLHFSNWGVARLRSAARPSTIVRHDVDAILTRNLGEINANPQLLLGFVL